MKEAKHLKATYLYSIYKKYPKQVKPERRECKLVVPGPGRREEKGLAAYWVPGFLLG